MQRQSSWGTYEIERIWYPSGIELVILCSQPSDEYILQFKFRQINTYSEKR
jgi:hypothetical protein